MTTAPAPPVLRIDCSRHFLDWLEACDLSLALSTYETGKLFLIGRGEGGRLSIFERSFNRAMGLWASGDARELRLATLYQIWCFTDALRGGRDREGYDRLYVPQLAWTTGELDIHDLAVDRLGRLLFVNTLMSCLATVDGADSFRPLWRPPFITRLAAEDRCHLNGLALREGVPAQVTAVARSDVADGWRDHREAGGVVIDLATDRVIAEGLSMPHSPRWHRDRLWLLESGRGWLGRLDPATGRFERVTFCPGYARGLAFHGDWAVVGISRPRGESMFRGLPLDRELEARGAVPRCGLLVIELPSGEIRHWLRFEGVVAELYDVALLPGVRRPRAVGLRSDEIRRLVTIGEAAPLLPAGE